MHHLSRLLAPKRNTVSSIVKGCQDLVRFFALRRIKPHTPLLVRAPVNSFATLRPYSPGGILIVLTAARKGSIPPTPSIHRLRRGLPGYLILFAPHAFAPQRQLMSSRPPSPLVFLPISTHSTATPGIPPTSALLKKNSFESSLWVEPIDFTSNLSSRLRSLYTQ